MHIFLTGPKGIGKTTALNRVLSKHPTLTLGGFRTVTCADVPGTFGSVFIIGAGEKDPGFGPDCRIGIRYGPPKGAERFPQVFDSRGLALLEKAEQTDLIVMDEIGFIEAAAPAFSARVLALLDSDTPIFGVLRQQGETPLQQAIRSHPSVRLLEVTIENRDDLPALVDEMLRRERNRRVDSAGVLALRGQGSGTEILMIKTRRGWAFPKGHIEPGETAREAALRELTEETGLTGELLPDFCFETTSGLPGEHRKIWYFLGSITGGTLTPQWEEIAGCEWKPLCECASLLHFAQDVPAVEAVCAALGLDKNRNQAG